MRILAILLSLCLLTGCSSFLEREYSSVEPHSSKFWESEAAGTLRAENYQDIVNDLLILVSQHTEEASLRLYGFEGDMTVTEMLDRAILEVQKETPLGAYAVEYISATREPKRGHYEITVSIGYRRTAEQIQAVVSATSTEALYSLLEQALQEGKTELAVRIGYWGSNGPEQVEAILTRLREVYEIPAESPCLIHYYPSDGPVGLIEFISDNQLAQRELDASGEDQLFSMLPHPMVDFTELEDVLPSSEVEAEPEFSETGSSVSEKK